MARLFRYLIWLLAGGLILAAVAWWWSRPATPGAFYLPPADPLSRPGVLLRQQAFARGVPSDAQAWRILYTTTRPDGSAAVASAIVMASRTARSEARPVIAWAHGTTGVVAGCAPSLLDDPFANVPALRQLLDRGWLYVATDYVGQGTPGPHPYLIGEGEARSVLDAIRALRQLEAAQASEDTVVWGHSQGGHAALWTGIVAPSYAPEIQLLGIAAIAPASDLRPLLDAVHATPVGRIMSSYVVTSYAAAYPDVEHGAYISGWKSWLARDIADRCLAGHGALFSVAEALLAGGSLFVQAPIGGTLGERLAQNTPNRPLQQPLLIAQGLADDLVLPHVQTRFVGARCDAGQDLEYRTYSGRDHLSVVAADSPLTSELVQWTWDRFQNVPWSANCHGADTQTYKD